MQDPILLIDAVAFWVSKKWIQNIYFSTCGYWF